VKRGAGILILAMLTACASDVTRDAAWEGHARQLTGQWVVALDFGPPLEPGTARRSPARGSITLLPNRAVDALHSENGPPTNYGTYLIDFSALGFNPSGTLVPGVFVGVERDSAYIEFETDRPFFAMRMQGAMRTDSIRGTWYAEQSRTRVAAGTFTMSRR